MLLTDDMQEGMSRIKALMEDINSVVTELEQAFDSADLKSKSADCQLQKQVENAIKSSKVQTVA